MSAFPLKSRGSQELSPLVNLRLVLIPVLLANCAGGKKGADFSGLVIPKCNPVAGLTRCSPVGFKENIFFVCFSLNPPDFQKCSRVADVQLSGNQNNLRSLGMMDVLPC